MHLQKSTASGSRFALRFPKTTAATLCAATLAARALAQQVLIPSPVIPPESQPIASPVEDTNLVASASATTEAPLVPRDYQPFQWGPLSFHPHLAYQFLSGTGIQSQTNQAHSTLIQQISPGIELDLGRVWKFDYTPTFLLYSDSHFRNSVDHLINLAGDTSYEDWKLGLAQNCAITSDPQIQTAQQTDQQTYLTSLKAAWQINSDNSLELGASQNLQYAAGFTSSRDWSTLDWLNHEWGPNLAAAGGVEFGYTSVDAGANMTHEQLQGRITWRVAHKVNLSINGGSEFRQFLDSTNSQLITPVFGAAITYQPFEVTTLSLNGARNLSASYFAGQTAEATSINVNLTQRLLKRFFLGLTGGYANTLYHGATDSRQDNYSFVSASLNTVILKRRGTVSLFYSASKNSSNVPGFAYSSNQVGFQLAYRY
jgi:hypothetical protein